MIEVPDFDQLYRDQPDPWRVGSSFYEQRKLDLVLAALTQPRYRRAWDPACGTGHLAARLAARCDAVQASDLAESAVDLARDTCRDLDNVAVHRRAVPDDDDPPGEPFDLVVLAEFLYYLDGPDRAALVDLVNRATGAQRAEIVLVHWRHHPHDGWLSGDAVNREFVTALGIRDWRRSVRVDDPGFVLEILTQEAPGDE